MKNLVDKLNQELIEFRIEYLTQIKTWLVNDWGIKQAIINDYHGNWSNEILLA